MYSQPPVPPQPRVHPEQKKYFESEELFRKLSRESEVRYTSHKDKALAERQVKFREECLKGHLDIAYVTSGFNLALSLAANPWVTAEQDRKPSKDTVDFEKEPGKVHLKSRFICNGVCVNWKGWIDCTRLDGTGCLEFDAEGAEIEKALQQERQEKYEAERREYDRHQRIIREQAEQSENLLRMRRHGGIKLEQSL